MSRLEDLPSRPSTEKDSPYLGMHHFMSEWQKAEHLKYVNGEVIIYDATKLFEEINEEMRGFRRDLARKFHASEQAAKLIILNA